MGEKWWKVEVEKKMGEREALRALKDNDEGYDNPHQNGIVSMQMRGLSLNWVEMSRAIHGPIALLGTKYYQLDLNPFANLLGQISLHLGLKICKAQQYILGP